MHQARLVQFVAVVASVVLVIGASTFMKPINDARSSLDTIRGANVVENTPPEYAFAIQAFGAFRSIITNIAFIRAEKFKEEGRYYDAMQLAEWICKLQPHFPAVWEFMAWNMSWNISVTTFTPEERWHWVYNGAKLLRDEGLKYNPRSVNLYKQLAWTFQNKMGADIDEFHFTYKKYWAWRMHLVLGPPPETPLGEARRELLKSYDVSLETDPFYQAARAQAAVTQEQLRKEAEERGEKFTPIDMGDEMATLNEAEARAETAAALAKIEAIAAAPQSLAALYAQTPGTREMVDALRDAGAAISDETLDEDEFLREDKGLAFTFFLPYRELTDPSTAARMRRAAAGDRPDLKRFDEIVGVSREDPAGQALLRFLQRKVLVEVYKNDPKHMADLVRQFGPMDWRIVSTQSLYWATEAIIASKGAESDFSNDKTNTLRILLFSLQDLARSNKLFFEPNPAAIAGSYYNGMPDPVFIESMHNAYVNYAREFSSRAPGQEQGAGAMFSAGHINFLAEGVRTLYFANRIAAAQKYYEFLRDEYGRHPNGTVREEYVLSLEEYAVKTFRDNATLPREATRMIYGMSMRSFDCMASDQPVLAYNWRQKARTEVWEPYMERRSADRLSLNPFNDMYENVFLAYIAGVAERRPLLHRAKCWANAPLTLRQAAYDWVKPYLDAECEAFEIDVDKAFPEPLGMAEYRAAHPVTPRSEEEGAEAETPAQGKRY